MTVVFNACKHSTVDYGWRNTRQGSALQTPVVFAVFQQVFEDEKKNK